MNKEVKMATENKEVEEMSKTTGDRGFSHYGKRLVIQGIFNSCYLALAMCQRARGPTFLDLMEIYETDMSTMSLSLAILTLGSLFGGLIGGYLLKHLHSFKFHVMSGIVFNLAFFHALTPFCPSVLGLHVVTFLCGVSTGAMHGGLGHLSFDNWHEGNPGPYVQSMHLFFSVGMVLAPMVAKPFLSHRKPTLGQHNNHDMKNSTTVTEGDFVDHLEDGDGAMHILYPALGLFMGLTALAFLYPAFSPIPTDQGHDHVSRRRDLDREGLPSWWLGRRRLLRLLVLSSACLAMAAHFAMDICISFYLPAFSIESSLDLTKAQAADVLTLYGLGNFMSRAMAIVQSMFLWPGVILSIDMTLIALGVGVAVLMGQNSLLVFTVAQVITALGVGSVAGSSWIWLGQYVPINSEVSAVLVVVSALGINVTPLTVGQIIEEWPDIFYYTVIISLIITMFGLATGTIVGICMLRKEAEIKTKNRLDNEDDNVQLRPHEERRQSILDVPYDQ